MAKLKIVVVVRGPYLHFKENTHFPYLLNVLNIFISARVNFLPKILPTCYRILKNRILKNRIEKISVFTLLIRHSLVPVSRHNKLNGDQLTLDINYRRQCLTYIETDKSRLITPLCTAYMQKFTRDRINKSL